MSRHMAQQFLCKRYHGSSYIPYYHRKCLDNVHHYYKDGSIPTVKHAFRTTEKRSSSKEIKEPFREASIRSYNSMYTDSCEKYPRGNLGLNEGAREENKMRSPLVNKERRKRFSTFCLERRWRFFLYYSSSHSDYPHQVLRQGQPMGGEVMSFSSLGQVAQYLI